jgi:hypothetical protein
LPQHQPNQTKLNPNSTHHLLRKALSLSKQASNPYQHSEENHSQHQPNQGKSNPKPKLNSLLTKKSTVTLKASNSHQPQKEKRPHHQGKNLKLEP